jgi:acyl dehydratase
MTQVTRRFDEITVGETLPTLAIDVTTTTIVAGALATRDFTPVHHDAGAARAQGLQNIIMNTLTTNGFVARYVTDWAGPDAVIRRIAIRLGTPNYPGETMQITGAVTAKDESEGAVEVTLAGRNSWGDHVTGTVRLTLPRGA